MTKSNELLLVQTALQHQTEAEEMARSLVEKQLAFCVQIAGPVVSVYRWRGKIEQQQELILTAKIHRHRYAEVAAWLEQHHSYEVPEIIAVPVAKVSTPYLQWALGEAG